MDDPRLMTPEEVATRLRLSPRTVVVWLRQGRIPGFKLGKFWRVREADLEELLSIEEAAKRLALSQRTLRDWLRAKKVPGVKLGRLWRVRESDLRAFIQDVRK